MRGRGQKQVQVVREPVRAQVVHTGYVAKEIHSPEELAHMEFQDQITWTDCRQFTGYQGGHLMYECFANVMQEHKPPPGALCTTDVTLVTPCRLLFNSLFLHVPKRHHGGHCYRFSTAHSQVRTNSLGEPLKMSMPQRACVKTEWTRMVVLRPQVSLSRPLDCLPPQKRFGS